MPQDTSAVTNKPPRVLVIDDEKMLAWTLSMLLTKAGYIVVTFNDPLLVIDELRERPVDLVISDVIMPGMSGIDLAIQLQKHRLCTKVLLLSGQANTLQLLAGAREQGFDFEVFPKPMLPSELLRVVQASVGAA